MAVTFLHTADWQLGRPFAGIEDDLKRSKLQSARFDVISRLGAVARTHEAAFLVVAGDLFDSTTATRATVSDACGKIGALDLPVYVIPGNHDHGGVGCLWDQPFFQAEQQQLAPNLQILRKREPLVRDDVVLFPCPLTQRHEVTDPTSWLRSFSDADQICGDKPRVVIAHGTISHFGGASDEDDDEFVSDVVNLIDPTRLSEEQFDYVALGDWHAVRQVGPSAWYSGTPEQDRFSKGDDYNAGNALIVTASRSEPPDVQIIETGSIGWYDQDFRFREDDDVTALQDRLNEMIDRRTNQDLLKLTLVGALGINASAELEKMLEACSARLLRVKLRNQTTITPSENELMSLTQRGDDPLVARVAARLVTMIDGEEPESQVARVALRELFAACQRQ